MNTVTKAQTETYERFLLQQSTEKIPYIYQKNLGEVSEDSLSDAEKENAVIVDGPPAGGVIGFGTTTHSE